MQKMCYSSYHVTVEYNVGVVQNLKCQGNSKRK